MALHKDSHEAQHLAYAPARALVCKSGSNTGRSLHPPHVRKLLSESVDLELHFIESIFEVRHQTFAINGTITVTLVIGLAFIALAIRITSISHGRLL